MILWIVWAQLKGSSVPHDVAWGFNYLRAVTSKIVHTHGWQFIC